MKYVNENRFTEDERDAMDGLARVVAYICCVDYDEMRSKSRKRELVDARKIACKYAYDNIPNSKFIRGRNLALPSWYFKCDHSSTSHAIHTADELYEHETVFAKLYDTVIEIVDNPNYEPDDDYRRFVSGKKIWENVRMDDREYHKTRYSVIPDSVKEEIINMFNKGYGQLSIANKVRTTVPFIDYFTKREGLKKNKMANIRKVIRKRRDKFGLSELAVY
jgi:hypothetical protein